MTALTNFVVQKGSVVGTAGRRETGWHGFGLALGAVLIVIGAFAVPVFILIQRSFTDPDLGFGNYQALLADGVSVPIIFRTITIAMVVTIVTFALSYPYAYVMTLVGPRIRALMMALALLPFWTSLMARTFAWVVLLQESGPLNALLTAIGIPTLQLLGTAAGVTVAMTQVLLPFMVLPVYATLSGIDRKLLSAAQGLGAHPAIAFMRVYFPLSLPGVVAGATMVFVLSLGFYITPAMLGSPREAVAAQLIATQINVLQFKEAATLAIALLVIAAISLLIMALVVKILNRPQQLRGGSSGN